MKIRADLSLGSDQMAIELQSVKVTAKPEAKRVEVEVAVAKDVEESKPDVVASTTDEDEDEVSMPVVKKAKAKKKAKPVNEDDDAYAEEDADEDEDEDEDDEGEASDTTSPVALALADLVNVPHKLKKNGEFSVNYNLYDAAALEDFESRNFDKIEVGSMEGVSLAMRSGLEGRRLERWMEHFAVIAMRWKQSIDWQVISVENIY